jgi:uncharacterized membrane protein
MSLSAAMLWHGALLLALHVVDYASTVLGLRRPGFYERNPIWVPLVGHPWLFPLVKAAFALVLAAVVFLPLLWLPEAERQFPYLGWQFRAWLHHLVIGSAVANNLRLLLRD